MKSKGPYEITEAMDSTTTKIQTRINKMNTTILEDTSALIVKHNRKYIDVILKEANRMCDAWKSRDIMPIKNIFTYLYKAGHISKEGRENKELNHTERILLNEIESASLSAQSFQEEINLAKYKYNKVIERLRFVIEEYEEIKQEKQLCYNI